MAGGGEIPADIIIQQDYASKLARLVWNDEINDWVEPNRPPLLHYNIVLLSLWSECQQVTLLATRPLRGTGCGRVARSGEFLFRTLDCYRSQGFFILRFSRRILCLAAMLARSSTVVHSLAARLAKHKLHPR